MGVLRYQDDSKSIHQKMEQSGAAKQLMQSVIRKAGTLSGPQTPLFIDYRYDKREFFLPFMTVN